MKVVTANRLGDGVVVYLADRGSWTARLDEAVRLDEVAAAAALEAATRAPAELVGPYLLEADDDGPVGRERLRELIRAGGPTTGSSRREAV